MNTQRPFRCRNPPNPAGHRTSYLWEEVWERDSWLEIIGRYLITRRDDKKKITGVTFPRYHQLDATRKLQAKVLKEGAGGKFLIQHSAGSGKTNSIAWSAHFLADLHDAKNEKLFATVIVISDRNVIDAQLQDALFDFQRTTGARASDKGITYVAFTATPKAKTLQLFGRPPKPDEPVGDGNLPAPFHVYSMRQAIEEGFILDVLKNYTPYRLAFRLANNGKEWDDKEVERDAALKGIMRWVRLHPYNISQKVQIVIEHYLVCKGIKLLAELTGGLHQPQQGCEVHKLTLVGRNRGG